MGLLEQNFVTFIPVHFFEQRFCTLYSRSRTAEEVLVDVGEQPRSRAGDRHPAELPGRKPEIMKFII